MTIASARGYACCRRSQLTKQTPDISVWEVLESSIVFSNRWLRVRKEPPAALDLVATTLVQHLGLLFVPAAVGVVMFWPQLASHAAAVVAALVASVVLTIAVTALVLRLAAGDAQGGR